jgi:hypothetical protein
MAERPSVPKWLRRSAGVSAIFLPPTKNVTTSVASFSLRAPVQLQMLAVQRWPR